MSSPYTGLPASPRATRAPTLTPITTTFPSDHTRAPTLTPITTTFPSDHTRSPTEPPPPYSDSTSPQTLASARQPRNRDSLIFINATIPLSPSSSTSSSPIKEDPYEGLAPRKRSGLARLFCCFGREERARRRVVRETEFEKVGEAGHWSEY